MAKAEANTSMSLDGYVTGPHLDRYPGLGEDGDVIRAWVEESRAMDFAFGEERQIAGSINTSRKAYDETGGWAAEDGFYRLPVFVVTHPSSSRRWRPDPAGAGEVVESRHATHLRYRVLK